MNKTTVFISYNKHDRTIANEIALYLAAENISVLFDEWEISTGDSITKYINDGLQVCTHFLIIWSTNSAKSKWVNRELQSIISVTTQTDTPKIIPIVLDQTSLPPLISDLKHISYGVGTEEDRANLIMAVTGNAPSQNFIRAIVKKYHEVISEDNGPFGYCACPQCGSNKLKHSSSTDNRDNTYYFIECSECKWSEWTQ
jgi:predicted nucleic-acid-binding Zn-ribbon protein